MRTSALTSLAIATAALVAPATGLGAAINEFLTRGYKGRGAVSPEASPIGAARRDTAMSPSPLRAAER